MLADELATTYGRLLMVPIRNSATYTTTDQLV